MWSSWEKLWRNTTVISPHLLVELGVENRSIAGVVLMLPDAVDTGEAAVVEEVEGFLESSFRRCSCRENKLGFAWEFWYPPKNIPTINQRLMCFIMPKTLLKLPNTKFHSQYRQLILGLNKQTRGIFQQFISRCMSALLLFLCDTTIVVWSCEQPSEVM